MTHPDSGLSTEEVRRLFAEGWSLPVPRMFDRGQDLFDQWLAEHDRQIRADERAKIADRIEGAIPEAVNNAYLAWSNDGMRDAAEIARGQGFEDQDEPDPALSTSSKINRGEL